MDSRELHIAFPGFWSTRLTLLLLTILVSLGCVLPAVAQQQSTSDLLAYYMLARTREIATENARQGNLRLEYRPRDPLDTKALLIQNQLNEMNWRALMASLPEPLETFSVTSVRLISKLESIAYKTLFSEADWSFVGGASRAPVDTMLTADIRARLESMYGPPTRTLAEIGYPDGLKREDIIQFEYWFLINGSIPTIILDVNGPWDRGVVLAAEMKYRSKLDHIKKTLFEQLSETPRRKEFIDYYYNFDQRLWYVTGFDGAIFFDKRIVRPNLDMGRPSPSLITERNSDHK